MMFIPCGGEISTKHNQILKFHKFRLFFNYLGMTQLMSGGGIIIVAQTVIPQLSSLFS